MTYNGLGLSFGFEWCGVGWVLGAFGLENQLVCVLCAVELRCWPPDWIGVDSTRVEWSRVELELELLPPFDDSVSTQPHFGA